ncbi:voltage-gated chloride channel family protein [Caloramator proteoclasticus]|uniref:H+/Cl-antiporter ClcA n=1 Tax=Caloramator proteoclasticus DSM 10124 TaxID=1121262 RepID=A0A1M4U525_9CLOT|nr:voltage-gated chloride channel family protein [Caloramator proteoclasticus]SHE51744.1 H+/Cl-antiporter ClcA [Caloramator proteoclasticus DSM 10124]
MFRKLSNIVKKLDHFILTVSLVKWLFLSSIVGVIMGVLSALFLRSLKLATDLREANPWLLFLLPLAGVFVSFLYSRYGKNSSKGNNLIIEQAYYGDREIPLRMSILVFVGTFLTHLFGGSAGREGTAVQMGGSISEFIGRLFKLDKHDMKIILMCGISSGFGSVFGTPLAGTIFAIEVIAIGYMYYEALIPCFISAFVGDYVATLVGATHSHYHILSVPSVTPVNVIKVIVASALFGLMSIVFSEGVHISKSLFSKITDNPMLKSFIGGFVVIALVYIFNTREYLGLGLPTIKEAFEGNVSKYSFILKTLFTSVTLGAGYQGGEVTPIFFVGSTLGNVLSDVLLMPASFLAALGLISVFCGATNTPISSFILGIEMFGSNGVVFMFIACIVSYLFSGHHGIYTSQRVYRSKSRLLNTYNEKTLKDIRENKIRRILTKGEQ